MDHAHATLPPPSPNSSAMLRHIATLLWNNRRQRLLLVGQILLSFLVLFGVFSFVGQKFAAYATPLGFDVADSYVIEVGLPEAIDTNTAARKDLFLRLRRELEGIPAVERASILGFIAPFDNSQWGWGETHDGVNVWTQIFMADEHYADAAEVRLARGRWFTPADTVGGGWRVVVNEAFLERNFPNTDMLDSTFTFFDVEEAGRRVEIVGVVENFKYLSEFAEEEPLTFVPDAPWDLRHEDHYMQGVTVRVAPGSPASLEEALFEAVAQVTGTRESVITPLERRRELTSREHWVPILLMLTICAFLVANVALGLFGILINAIAKRRGEIGLRKALGATGWGVTAQLTAEVTLVALAALLLGAALAAQVSLFELIDLETRHFVWGGVAAAALILGLVLACALIPSGQAARIHPAVALREE